jgi:hypothetical protein
MSATEYLSTYPLPLSIVGGRPKLLVRRSHMLSMEQRRHLQVRCVLPVRLGFYLVAQLLVFTVLNTCAAREPQHQ